MVPQTAIGNDGRMIGDAYVEIGPQDAEYARLAAQAMTEDEAARRRAQWRDGDDRPAKLRLPLVRAGRRGRSRLAPACAFRDAIRLAARPARRRAPSGQRQKLAWRPAYGGLHAAR
ncbi:MAG: hypothetical protein ABR922_10185 [Streptosporangiaceae bacterium]